jgi:hypothetical protein
MKGFSNHMLPGAATERTPGTRPKGFNYGRGLPWHKLTDGGRKLPQEYIRTEALRAAVAARQSILSAAEWELGQALSHVRQADTEDEMERALAALRDVRAKNDPIGIDGTFNVANMPSDAEPTGDKGNGHVFFFEDLPIACDE